MENIEKLRDIRLFLFDMDGTLYIGDRLFDFTVPLLDKIKKSGGRYMFFTNNSSKSVSAYIEKLKKLGIEAGREDFLTSSQATAFYLRENHSRNTFYVCGTRSLKEELRHEGFNVTETRDRADAVIMGFDTELTFQKLEDVCRLLMAGDIPYIATNPDLVCPTEFGSVPDCGSVCHMIYNATGKRPVVIGKPSPLMPELAMKKTGCSREETAVIGDRIYTDVKSGLNAGALGVLVMSGETTEEILKNSEDKPDIVLKDAGEIMKYLD